MKCSKHPQIWLKEELDINELSIVLECQDCLGTFESRILAEIKSGKIPAIPDDFAEEVLDRINCLPPKTGAQNTNIKRLTFIHFVAAAAVAISLALSGAFNLVFHSATDCSAAFNRYINDVTAVTSKVSVQNFEIGLGDIVKSRLGQKAKSKL